MIIGFDVFLSIQAEDISIHHLMIKRLEFGIWTLEKRRKKWKHTNILYQLFSSMENMESLDQPVTIWL